MLVIHEEKFVPTNAIVVTFELNSNGNLSIRIFFTLDVALFPLDSLLKVENTLMKIIVPVNQK